MDLEGVISEKGQRKTNNMISLICRIKKTIHRYKERFDGCQTGGGMGEKGGGIKMCKCPL